VLWRLFSCGLGSFQPLKNQLRLLKTPTELVSQIDDINAAIHKKSYTEVAMQPVMEVDQPATAQCFTPVQFWAITAVSRKENLISSSTTCLNRKLHQVAHDVSQFESIVNEHLKVDRVRIAKAVHLGAHKESRPRLLLVSMDCERSKWRVLNQA